MILYCFGCGIIKFVVKGGYMDKEKEVIYVVVMCLEVMKLKLIVYEIDENVFVMIMSM